MWVASGVSITRTISNSTLDGNTSNSRRPPPNSTGIWWICNSSSTPGLERPLRGVGAMHQHVPVPGGRLRLSHRARDTFGHVFHQRIVGDRGTGWPMAGHEDRDAVMIAFPVIGLLHSAPARQHRTGRVHLADQLSGRPGRPEELPVRTD